MIVPPTTTAQHPHANLLAYLPASTRLTSYDAHSRSRVTQLVERGGFEPP
jgi:hypothetical protein